MSKEYDDGGPAFPTEQGHCPDGLWNQTFDPGMTLWDHYAAAAYVCCRSDLQSPEAVAEHCGNLADAMIAERKKRFG